MTDRQGVVLWRHVAASLEDAITGGRHGPEDRLPSEGALSARFGVNRHTVRRALASLAERGLIRTEQGRGSFVAGEVLDYPLRGRPRFTETFRAQSREPSARILRLETRPADPGAARALGLGRGASVLRLERLSLVDGRPVVLAVHHLPLPRFEGAEAALRADPSITLALAASGVADYRRVRTRITARLPTREEARLLRQSRERPVLSTESLNRDMEGRPVDHILSCYAAGRTQVMVEEVPETAKGKPPCGGFPF